ncbi:MAG: thiamine-phosphate kinase [Bacteroidales bacterium]|nr:thiamine-phosphate kinase [Bacteroidales bacterium]
MKISKIGEFGLIEEVIAPEFRELVNKHLTGIGDDAAIVPIDKHTSHIHTTDMLIEKTHFLRDKISPYQLGYKSLSVNLSDIAAMGGKPIASYLSIGLPKDMEVEWVEEFMKGYKALSEEFQVPLLGGDTASSEDKIIINVGVTGEIPAKNIKLRSAAQENDVICLTGKVGDSAGGLQLILNDLPVDNQAKKLLEQHLTPTPQIIEGIWLSEFDAVHAMMDVSDGIASDLKHILKASAGLKGIIELDNIPMSEELIHQSETHQWNPLELSVSGGEDYVLLLTVDKKEYETLAGKFREQFSRPLYKIGYLEHGEREIIYLKNNKEVKDLKEGYSHF